MGSKKKFPLPYALKKKLRRLRRPQNPLFCTTILGSVEGGGYPCVATPLPFGVGS